MSFKRTIVAGGTKAVPARIHAHADRLMDATAHRGEGLSKSFAPVRTGRLRDSIGTQRKGHAHFVCFADVDYAEPVERGHHVYNQWGGPYGYVPAQPFMLPGFAIAVAELPVRSRAVWGSTEAFR
jgi:hypothetical protein